MLVQGCRYDTIDTIILCRVPYSTIRDTYGSTVYLR